MNFASGDSTKERDKSPHFLVITNQFDAPLFTDDENSLALFIRQWM
jgi:hypothetical protein